MFYIDSIRCYFLQREGRKRHPFVEVELYNVVLYKVKSVVITVISIKINTTLFYVRCLDLKIILFYHFIGNLR